MQFSTEYKYVEAVSEDNKSATIRLDGTMGHEIDGASVAAEINFLDKIIGVKEIHVRLNTPGGSVFDSLSIVGAIKASTAKIHGHNDGMCMSAGFHTFLSCDVLHAYDHSIFMYHNPRRKDGVQEEEGGLVSTIKESMSTLIAGRLGKTVAEVDTMLDSEKFFLAGRFKEIFGIDIQVEKSESLPKITNSMTLEEVVAEYDNFNTNLNEEEMSKENEVDYSNVLASLEIEATVENPLAEIESKVSSVVAENVALTEAKSTLTAQVEGLQAKLDVIDNAEAEAYVAELVKDNLVKEESKETILAAYKEDSAKVIAIYDSMPAPAASDSIVADKLERKDEGKEKELKIEVDAEGNKKDFQWMSENEPDVLAEMETLNPEKFNFLLNEYVNDK
jgi:ATP-dependent protease ClpP protease subunit